MTTIKYLLSFLIFSILVSLPVLAGEPVITQYDYTNYGDGAYNTTLINKNKGGISFELLLMRNSGDHSYWCSDPELWVDDVKICTLSELGIPVVEKKSGKYDDKAWEKKLRALRSEQYILKSKTYSDYLSVATYDPRYVTLKHLHWVKIGLVLGYNIEGGSHHVEIRGYWNVNNSKNGPVWKVLDFYTKAYSTNEFPANAGTAKRQNEKVTWNFTGLKEDIGNYKHVFSLQKTNNHPQHFQDKDVQTFGYWTKSNNATTYTNSFSCDNYEPVTIYPRIILLGNKKAECFNDLLQSSHSFRKDYNAVTLKGYPRAANVRTLTTDAYKKYVKIDWSSEIKNKNHVDTKGKWGVFRRKITGQSTSDYNKIAEVDYKKCSYEDKESGKQYYDKDLNEDTEYEYTICFMPNGWTVNTPDDAKGLYATAKHKFTRTFAISKFNVIGRPNGVTIEWGISSITDAKSGNTYTLDIQRRDKPTDAWKVIKSEVINSESKTSGSYTDKNDLYSYEDYQYRLFINVQGKDYESDIRYGGLTSGTTVKSFTATRGIHAKSVKLQWSVNKVGNETTYYILQRRPLGSTDNTAWNDIYTTNGTASLYSYEDEAVNPGSYYEYHLRLWVNRGDSIKGIRDYTTDGFALATGVLSGRVYYDNGTAVKDVKITLTPSVANGEDVNQFRSLRIDNVSTAGIRYTAKSGVLQKLMGKEYTIQMYLSPDADVMMGEADYPVFATQGALSLSLKYNNDGNDYILYANNEATKLRLPANRWSHVSVTVKDRFLSFYLNGLDSVQSDTLSIATTLTPLANDTTLVLGNNVTRNSDSHFIGYVDEFRLFTKALTIDEIAQNYSHTLAGNEDGLAIYWPMDEKLTTQTLVYDYSKSNDASNARIGFLDVPATSSEYIPNDDQLSLCGYTDKNGNFMIRGIPFSGEGTNYIATPTLGIHKFSPSNVSCYVSNNSLVFSGKDFKDVSSFPVRGRVRYANTTIPVEGANLNIDGLPVTKYGQAVTTDENGDYEIDVPIGDHYVSVTMPGHTFAGGGSYPENAKETGSLFTFEQSVSNLDFFDETTVTVAGRVAGGATEENKPLGVGVGVANIGKAIIVLNFKDDPYRDEFIHAKRQQIGNAYYYVQDSTRRDFNTTIGHSRAYVPIGKNYIQVETDSMTGEFAVDLPPLRYTTSRVYIPSQSEIRFTQRVIDATNASATYTDSLVNDTVASEYFTYHAAAKFTYRSPVVLDITENGNGAFGRDSVMVTDINGDKKPVAAYSIEADSVKYAFGYPLYEQGVEYTYDINAYERYVNKDGESPVDYIDPLSDLDVTLKNEYASTTTLTLDSGAVHQLTEENFTLDSSGHATYNFVAGLPNIHAPYTRSLHVSYDVSGQTIEWDKTIKAIVLGSLTNGNNFVTAGPDKVLFILRDPPGSQSKTTYSKGTSFTRSFTNTQKAGNKDQTILSTKVGLELESIIGSILGGVVNQSEATNTISAGLEVNLAYGHNDTKTTTTTLTEQVSTSNSPNFVGAVGDVFVGMSTNTIVGSSRVVYVKKDETTGNYFVTMDNMLATGEKFNTAFNYTTYQIENKVIPDFISMRNVVLQRVGSIDSVRRPAAGMPPLYVTTLSEDNPNYGTSNDDPVWGKKAVEYYDVKDDGLCIGPSYAIILPVDCKRLVFQDTVKYFNEQVKMWKQQLANNEQAKVTAISEREKYIDKNYSFDSGASVSVTHSKKNHHDATHSLTTEMTIIGGSESRLVVHPGVAVTENVFKITNNTYFSGIETWGNTSDSTKSISYTLQESGLGEAISVDVFDAPDGFGPIFYTRGGTTSNPYEDEVVTKYYKPGTIISEKTVQVEKPEIIITDPIVTGVPAGGTATFKVKLVNNSEAQKAVTYNLLVVGNNPNGAQVGMEGRIVNNGISMLLPFGETEKTFTLKQTNTDVMDYKDITLRLCSPSQPNDLGTFPSIYSDGKVSVYFQPACSDIRLEASRSVFNAEDIGSGHVNPIDLSMSGYDYSMASLMGIQLEYKGVNDTDFKLLQKYVKDSVLVKADSTLRLLPALTGGSKLVYQLDMSDRSFSDQDYVFRAVTCCRQGETIVNNESDEVTVSRDLSRPQLIATPSPATGILTPGDDISLTFNEDISSGSLTLDGNFIVNGQLNERQVSHKIALSLEPNTKAKTSATIDLNMQSFSIDMWLNYTADGRLLYHGVPAYGFAADIDGGRLVLTLDSTKVTSTNTLPKNKWLYLHVSYDNTGVEPMVSASCFQDNNDVTLINQQTVPAYSGSGLLTLGGGTFSGKVQELSLWSIARSMTAAQTSMYTTKNVFTDALVAYWPFDEGHGQLAEDKARSRNITLPSENNWWTSTLNYAAVLDGNTAFVANISSATTTTADSYLLEGWVKAEKGIVGDVVIFNVADSMLSIGLDANGQLKLMVNKIEGTAPTADLRDNAWHHIAFNVLKSTKGTATLYLDGTAVRQFSADDVPALQSDAIIIGARRSSDTGFLMYDKFFKGAVDEIRLWKSRRTADVIKEMMYTRVDTLSEGLVAYYPMEISTLDGNNQIVVLGSGKDVTGRSITTIEAVYGFEGTQGKATFSTASAPSLTDRKNLENVKFSFVANERTVRVNLDELPSRLEGCIVNVTAKGICDLHGNGMEPVTWSFYVNQSTLKWDEKAVTISKNAISTVKREVVFRNISGQAEKYNVIGVPSWLSIDHASGTLQPLDEEKLTITINPGLAIGTYESTIWLIGSQNLELPLRLTVRVEGERPNWTAEEGEYMMNVIGQLSVNGILSTDTADIVGAFIDDRCVGVASPLYLESYDAYMLLFNIYGHEIDNKAEINYQAYDASTGHTYPVVSASLSAACRFTPDTWVGTFGHPVVFTSEPNVSQNIGRDSEGWSWISLYVKPDNVTPDSIFSDVSGAVILVKNFTQSYTQSRMFDNDRWFGDAIMMNNSDMYKVKSSDAYKLTVSGLSVNPETISITLNKKWSWIGYPIADANTLDAALVDAAPMEGDIIKSRTLFAMYTDGRWIGNLKALMPSEGYIYYSHADESKTFHYPNVVRQNGVYRIPMAASVDSNDIADGLPDYENNMTMVAVVKDGDIIVPNATVEVYANGELRGRSKADVDGLHFITIGGGSEPEMLTFVVSSANGICTLRQKLQYQADDHYGSPALPTVLQLSSLTGISDFELSSGMEQVDLFTTAGRLILRTRCLGGKLSESDMLGLPVGVYIQHTTHADGSVETKKVTKG